MHHPQKGGARHIAGQALNDARLQVDHHGVAKTLGHECDTLVVGRNVRAFPEMGQNLDIRRQMIERAAWGPLRERKSRGEKQNEQSHSGNTIKASYLHAAFRVSRTGNTFHHPTPQCKLPCS